MIYKSRGVKRVLTKTNEGPVWVEEKLKPVRKIKRTVPVPPLVGAERLRVADVLALLKISRSTLYAGVATGRYPPFDGKDGNMPFWKASTMKRFLEEEGQ